MLQNAAPPYEPPAVEEINGDGCPIATVPQLSTD